MYKKLKRAGIIILCVFLISIMFINGGVAKEFPTKPISLIVCWAPGSGTDIGARILTSIAPRYFEVPVVVYNKVGGGGTIGTRYVANAKPDGYTLLYGYGGGEHLLAPHLRAVPFNVLEDFEPIILVTSMPPVIVARADSPFETLDEIIKYAREHPGELKYGASGTGTTTDLAPVMLGLKAGVKFTGVPFKGSGPTVAAVMGGHVELGSVPIAAAASLLEAGKLKAFAIAAPKRFPAIPDIPTFKELGYDVAVESLKGIAAPKGTPKEIIKKLHDRFKKCLDDPQMKKLMHSVQLDIVYQGPEEYRRTIRDYYFTYGEILKKMGLAK